MISQKRLDELENVADRRSVLDQMTVVQLRSEIEKTSPEFQEFLAALHTELALSGVTFDAMGGLEMMAVAIGVC